MLLNQSFPGSILRDLSARYRLHATDNAIAGLSLLIAITILASGCTATADNAIAATLGENFQLRVGQSALIESVNMEIGFLGVSSDSRCGKGEACIVEGDAIVRIWLRLDGGDKQERELHTGSKMPNAVDYANFSIGLVVLHPAAIAGRAIAPADYIATIRVARGTSGGKVIY